MKSACYLFFKRFYSNKRLISKRITIFAIRKSVSLHKKSIMNENATYWIELSDYDFETAKAMLNTKRYLYVGFMCHQVIEKILKAYWSIVIDEPPLKIHSLSRLAEKTGLDKLMTIEQLDFIDELEPLNIEARYPSTKKG